MSSFIHSSTHLRSIEQGIINLNDFHSYGLPFDRSETPIKDIKKMVREWGRLNIFCVYYQYKLDLKNISAEVEEINLKVKPVGLSEIALYKAVCSLYYQCEVEHIPEDRKSVITAFHYLELFKARLAEHIVENTGEFDNAKTWMI